MFLFDISRWDSSDILAVFINLVNCVYIVILWEFECDGYDDLLVWCMYNGGYWVVCGVKWYSYL